MSLLSIAPFSCAPLLRRFPTTARNTITLRTGFRTLRCTESGVRCLSCDYRKLVCPRKVLFRDLLGRSQQVGADLRSLRAKSSVHGQQVASGEKSLGANPESGLLILYSKPGCCLCDGLKEKLEGSEILSNIQLEVRDITTNSEWWNLYQYEIPVLARIRGDGIEEPLPRLSPRLSAEQVQKKLFALLNSVA